MLGQTDLERYFRKNGSIMLKRFNDEAARLNAIKAFHVINLSDISPSGIAASRR
jgi:hypothetical protein